MVKSPLFVTQETAQKSSGFGLRSCRNPYKALNNESEIAERDSPAAVAVTNGVLHQSMNDTFGLLEIDWVSY